MPHFTPRQYGDMAMALGDDMDLGGATQQELDALAQRYAAAKGDPTTMALLPEIQALYDAATQILHDCRHTDRTCEVSMGHGVKLMTCTDCYNAQVYARRAAEKAQRAAEPKDCQRCAAKPVRWTYGGYRLCGRCKTTTQKEHQHAAAQAGVFGLFAQAPLVDTTTWAGRHA
jgi:hypothetical protein